MTLDEYSACFNLNYEQFLAVHDIADGQIDKNVRYEKIMDVTRVTMGKFEAFHFKDGQLKLIYISNEKLTQQLWSEFKQTTDVGSPEKTVRSRAGKTSNQLIFASKGIAASITKAEVDFMEIFPPCSVQTYLDNIYREVGPFIR